MENLLDLYVKLNLSSLDKDAQEFLKEAIELVASGKSQAHLEKLVDSFLDRSIE